MDAVRIPGYPPMERFFIAITGTVAEFFDSSAVGLMEREQTDREAEDISKNVGDTDIAEG